MQSVAIKVQKLAHYCWSTNTAFLMGSNVHLKHAICFPIEHCHYHDCMTNEYGKPQLVSMHIEYVNVEMLH